MYLLRDPITQAVVRTGRTIDFFRRAGEHARDALTAALKFERVWYTDNLMEQKGLEQILYDMHPEAFLNKIRPVALDNPNLGAFLEAAARFLQGH